MVSGNQAGGNVMAIVKYVRLIRRSRMHYLNI